MAWNNFFFLPSQPFLPLSAYIRGSWFLLALPSPLLSPTCFIKLRHCRVSSHPLRGAVFATCCVRRHCKPDTGKEAHAGALNNCNPFFVGDLLGAGMFFFYLSFSFALPVRPLAPRYYGEFLQVTLLSAFIFPSVPSSSQTINLIKGSKALFLIRHRRPQWLDGH